MASVSKKNVQLLLAYSYNIYTYYHFFFFQLILLVIIYIEEFGNKTERGGFIVSNI